MTEYTHEDRICLPLENPSWNHRVLREGGSHKIVEVYYNKGLTGYNGLMGYSDAEIVHHSDRGGDPLESLRQQVAWFATALDKPVLEPSDFGNLSRRILGMGDTPLSEKRIQTSDIRCGCDCHDPRAQPTFCSCEVECPDRPDWPSTKDA